MADYPAGEITHNGVTVPIFVDDWGHWKAEYAGVKHTEADRSKLDARLKRVIKRTVTKVSVPFVQVHPQSQKFKRGTATGIHAGTGNVLVEWEDGTKEQITRGYGGAEADHLANVSDAELATWLLLTRARREANMAYQVFMKDRTMNLKDQVMLAVDEAAAKARGDA